MDGGVNHKCKHKYQIISLNLTRSSEIDDENKQLKLYFKKVKVLSAWKFNSIPAASSPQHDLRVVVVAAVTVATFDWSSIRGGHCRRVSQTGNSQIATQEIAISLADGSDQRRRFVWTIGERQRKDQANFVFVWSKNSYWPQRGSFYNH